MFIYGGFYLRFPPQFFLSRSLVYFYDVLLLLNVYHCCYHLLLLFICMLFYSTISIIIDAEVVSLCWDSVTVSWREALVCLFLLDNIKIIAAFWKSFREWS